MDERLPPCPKDDDTDSSYARSRVPAPFPVVRSGSEYDVKARRDVRRCVNRVKGDPSPSKGFSLKTPDDTRHPTRTEVVSESDTRVFR